MTAMTIEPATELALVPPHTCYRCDGRPAARINAHPVAPMHRKGFGTPEQQRKACYRQAKPETLIELGRDLLGVAADHLIERGIVSEDDAFGLAWDALRAVFCQYH